MALRSPVRNQVDTPTRILDAAFDCVRDVGLGRTTVEDVARAGGLTRQPIYRYFPSKDHVVISLVLREEDTFLEGVRTAFAAEPDLEGALTASIAFCLRFAREHPLLDRLLATDPETFLPYLTTRSAPVVMRARGELKSLIARKAWVRTRLLDGAADAAVRILISYAVSPPDRDEDEVAADLAQILATALAAKEGAR
jgi:AcrR family transcriptional regulator